MGKIIRLSKEIAEKIAAGEVVESPASVVKELVENSLDASASNVKVFIEDGGKKMIKVVDDGEGMSQEDADTSGYYRGTDEGGKLKETGSKHWTYTGIRATNESGFTGLPGGYRYYTGQFYNMRNATYILSSTERDTNFIWYRGLFYSFWQVSRFYNMKNNGYTVRCVKN